MVHRMTTSGKTSDNEWQRVVQRVIQRVATSDKEWQRVAILANSFFLIREESTTKHPKENSLNIKEDLEEKRDIEFKSEGCP